MADTGNATVLSTGVAVANAIRDFTGGNATIIIGEDTRITGTMGSADQGPRGWTFTVRIARGTQDGKPYSKPFHHQPFVKGATQEDDGDNRVLTWPDGSRLELTPPSS